MPMVQIPCTYTTSALDANGSDTTYVGLCGITIVSFGIIPLILSRYYYDHGVQSVETVDNIQMNPCHTD